MVFGDIHVRIFESHTYTHKMFKKYCNIYASITSFYANMGYAYFLLSENVRLEE